MLEGTSTEPPRARTEPEPPVQVRTHRQAHAHRDLPGGSLEALLELILSFLADTFKLQT